MKLWAFALVTLHFTLTGCRAQSSNSTRQLNGMPENDALSKYSEDVVIGVGTVLVVAFAIVCCSILIWKCNQQQRYGISELGQYDDCSEVICVQNERITEAGDNSSKVSIHGEYDDCSEMNYMQVIEEGDQYDRLRTEDINQRTVYSIFSMPRDNITDSKARLHSGSAGPYDELIVRDVEVSVYSQFYNRQEFRQKEIKRRHSDPCHGRTHQENRLTEFSKTGSLDHIGYGTAERRLSGFLLKTVRATECKTSEIRDEVDHEERQLAGQVLINPTCGNGRIIVKEDGHFSIKCLHAYDYTPVTWMLNYANGSNEEVGTCRNFTCTTRMLGANLKSRITASELNFTRINRAMDKGVLQCFQRTGIQTTSIILNVQYPAVLENCSIWNNSEINSVSGFCHVPKVYRASKYYCRWFEFIQGSSQIQQIANGTVSLTPFNDSSGFLYYQGNCSLIKTNFSLKQSARYSVDFVPGTVLATAVVKNSTTAGVSQTVPGTARSGLTTVYSTTTDIISTASDGWGQATFADYLIAGIIGFVTGTAVTLIIIVIIFILRRKTKRTSEDGANNITTNDFQVDNASKTDVPKENEGTYSALQMAEVGQRSPYANIHIYKK